MSSHQGGRAGVTAWFVVPNRAQRCEYHKLAVFLVGGRDVVLRADLVLVAILVKTILRANLKTSLPPSVV